MSAPIVGAALTGRDLTMQRRFDAAPAEVWAALADPDRRVRWLGVPDATIEVVRCEPPRLVEVRWRSRDEPDSLAAATLVSEGDGTLLTLRHRRVPPASTLAAGVAWQSALGDLAWAVGAAAHPAADWSAIARADLEIVRELAATPAAVWRALATRDGLASWWWVHWDGVEVSADVREGGRFDIRAPHQRLGVSGVYLDVEPERRLAFSWVWHDDEGESVDEAVDIRLEPVAAGTRLVLRHTGPWTDDSAADAYRQGWNFTLAALAATLGAGATPS